MFVPHAWLWRGVSTRGPAEKASCSNSSSSSVPRRHAERIIRQRPVVQARSYEPTAVLQLTSSQPRRNGPGDSNSSSAGNNNPGSSRDDGEDAGQAFGRDNDERQSALASSGKILKINIDLMLWRSRTSRIRAWQTLDTNERKTLLKVAEDGLRRCLALDPSDPRAYVVLGKSLVQQKRYDEARALYQDGCANTGNTNPYIWSAWGWLEALTGNVDRARKLYDAAVVVDGTHACAWHKWGMLEKKQGNYTRARDLWMQGIQRCRRKPQSQNSYLYCALACMAAQLGRVGEARAWFEEGTRTAAGAASVALWQAWGCLEATQGDPTAVRYLFRKALQANPRSRYVHLAWALWEFRQGNPRQCLMLLQRGCQLNPTDPALYQAWALMEKRGGRIPRARALFERGLKADPGYIYLWQAYGVMEAELGNLDRARQLFQEGVWADPRSPDTVFVFHAWGALECRAGNHQTARELFKAAVRIDPKNETTWASWIAMESELGFVERADELRIRRAEQQWEFVVPPGFTTRPAPGLMDTLARFFAARGFGAEGAGAPAGASTDAAAGAAVMPAGAAAGAAAAAPAVIPETRGPGSLASMLPQGYSSEGEQQLRLDDIERLMTGDLGALPDFIAADDDVEASLRRPQQQQQQQLQRPQLQRPPQRPGFSPRAPLPPLPSAMPSSTTAATGGTSSSSSSSLRRPASAPASAPSQPTALSFLQQQGQQLEGGRHSSTNSTDGEGGHPAALSASTSDPDPDPDPDVGVSASASSSAATQRQQPPRPTNLAQLPQLPDSSRPGYVALDPRPVASRPGRGPAGGPAAAVAPAEDSAEALE